jgi:hypothetical protein
MHVFTPRVYMYINSVFYFANLRKTIQIVSHHESDSDQRKYYF